ncbi:YitT family protein [Enterococcus sp. MJM12]|uniref:YitT family protein n=1 Tax=Candidatus Enterococcus myersii TaxID=2815322 RepID=A0ABS3H4M3_9ENTE|nr:MULTISPECIES: YitT family protein [Enterococcus]MBO0448402.1 YitT family protein [Enterococcus sp. MJM12]MDT2739803.1 YitT family protein [Enterococcus canintestini]
MLKSFLKIFFGNLILGLAYAKLMVPNEIINGGVTSLSLIFSNLTSLNITLFTNVITVILLTVSLIFLGKFFFFSSVVSSVSYLLFFNIFYRLPFTLHTNIVVDFVIAVVLIAIGYYCCLSENSSTAGLDVFAVILNRKFPKISMAVFLRYLNITVLVLGLFSYGVQAVILGVLFSFSFTKVMDILMKKSIDPRNFFHKTKRMEE